MNQVNPNQVESEYEAPVVILRTDCVVSISPDSDRERAQNKLYYDLVLNRGGEGSVSPIRTMLYAGWTDGIGMGWLSYVVGSLRAPSVLIKSRL